MGKYKSPQVVFVPWYVKKAMELNKIDLSLISPISYEYENSVEGYDSVEQMVKGSLNSLSKLARIDIIDLGFANTIIPKELTGYPFDHEIGFDFLPTKEVVLKKFYSELYSEDLDKSKNEFLNALHGDVDESIGTHSIVIDNDTVFVILNEGFTNFIVNKDKKASTIILKEIVESLHTVADEKSLFMSKYFARFLEIK